MNHVVTIYHLVWECQHTQALRLEHMKKDSSNLVREDCLTCLRGLFSHPASAFPPPSPSILAEFLALTPDGLCLVEEADFGKLSGKVFTDGAYHRNLHGGLGRWAVIQPDHLGHSVRAIRGPLPDCFSQNAMCAEWMVAAVAVQFLDKGELYIDCSAVVLGLQEWLAGRPQLSKQHAGFLLFAMNQEGSLLEVHKVKAHRTKDAATDPKDLATIVANSHADSQANLALGLHPQFEPSQIDLLEQKLDLAKLTCRLAPEALLMYPRAPKSEGRIPKVGPRQGCAGPPHRFRLVREGWQCLDCLTMVRSRHRLRAISKKVCRGVHEGLKQLMVEGEGRLHKLLWTTVESRPLVFCTSCGGYAIMRLQKLGQKCWLVCSSAGKSALVRLQAGFHPTSRLPFDFATWRIRPGGLATIHR